MPNDLPNSVGSTAAGTVSKMGSNKNTGFFCLLLLKSFFFSVLYETRDLNFWATEKKQGQIWNHLKNIYKRTEPVFWFLIQFAWKKLLKIGYFADIPVFPGVKNIFPCIKKLKQNLKKRLCMSNYMLLRIPKYSLFLFLVENKGIDNFELHKVPK